MITDVLFTPALADNDKYFDSAALILVDVLRASSTICAALHNGAKEVIPSPSLENAVEIYHSLPRQSRYIGGERECIKPSSFDAGNSPFDYPEEKVKDKTVILTTTNGTKILSIGRKAKIKLIGSFVNFSILSDFLIKFIEKNDLSKIVIICAGSDGKFSYEDVLYAGALIDGLKGDMELQLTDSADAAIRLYHSVSNELVNFVKNTYHAKRLIGLGFEKDIDVCLKFDAFPALPFVDGSLIKKMKNING